MSKSSTVYVGMDVHKAIGREVQTSGWSGVKAQTPAN